MPAAEQDKPATELVRFVRDNQKAGLKDAQIRQIAVKAGWDSTAVDDAISYVRVNAAPTPEPTGATEQKKKGAEAISAAVNVPTNAPPPGVAAPPTSQQATPAQPETPTATIPDSAAVVPLTKEPAARPAGGVGVVKGSGPYEYKIGEGDVLQISVYGEPGASVQSVVVRPDGRITVPLVKEVSVAGLTPPQLETILSEQLSPLIRAPDVTVVVAQINSKKIYLTGALKREGILPYTYRMTVMQAISEAGGLTDYAKRKKIYVLRNQDGKQLQLPFDYDAVLKGRRMELNIPLVPGDQIVVPN
jgi:polysaccharide export outer membrane protein